MTSQPNRRIEPIGTLDEALDRAVADYDEADAKLLDFMAQHADTLAELDRLRSARATAYHDASSTAEAIKKLGYIIRRGDGLGDRTYAAGGDLQRALDRRAEAEGRA